MPLPALLLNPWTLGILGGILPSIVSALAGSKTPEEARAAIEPQHNAMVTQLVGRGMRRSEAIEQADEALKGALADKMDEGAVPPWADMVMSVAGGIGGGALGSKLAKGAVKGATKSIGKAATAEAADAAAVQKGNHAATKGVREVPDAAYAARKGEINAANKAAADAGKFDQVSGEVEAMPGREVALRPMGENAVASEADEVLPPFARKPMREVVPDAVRDGTLPPLPNRRDMLLPFGG